jgi:hypothetical protein
VLAPTSTPTTAAPTLTPTTAIPSSAPATRFPTAGGCDCLGVCQNTNTTSTVVTNGTFINCTRMLLAAEEFIADLKTQTFEDDRIDIIYKDLVNTCVTAAQVYKILELITFESSKYEVAQFLYFRTTDRQILDKGMLPLFTFDSTKMDWREFVRKNQ